MQAKGLINLQFTDQILISWHRISRIQDSLVLQIPSAQVSAANKLMHREGTQNGGNLTEYFQL